MQQVAVIQSPCTQRGESFDGLSMALLQPEVHTVSESEGAGRGGKGQGKRKESMVLNERYERGGSLGYVDRDVRNCHRSAKARGGGTR